MSALPPLNPVPFMDLSQFHEGERAVSIMACENYARLYAQEAVRAEREANALRCDAEVVRLTEQGEPRAALVAGICAAAIRGIHPQDVGAQMAQLQAAAIRRSLHE